MPASTAAVDEWARTEGHYVLEGDQPVIPIVQPGSEPVIVATPSRPSHPHAKLGGVVEFILRQITQ